jgi:hypothetical protein
LAKAKIGRPPVPLVKTNGNEKECFLNIHLDIGIPLFFQNPASPPLLLTLPP